MTLNGVIALILHYFTEFDNFAGQLCHTVVEDRHIMSAKLSLNYLWLKLTHATVARSLCDS